MSMIKTGGIALRRRGRRCSLAWFRGRKRRKLRDQATTYVVEQLRRRNEPTVALPAEPGRPPS